MRKLTLKTGLLYGLPLLTVAVGPFLLAGASKHFERGRHLERERNLEIVRSMPNAVVEQSEHDFGLMDPLTEGSHVFVIRNQGGGELQLSLGRPSSPSLRGELTRPLASPGGAAEVRVTWKTGASQPAYTESVTLQTNGSGQDDITLIVHGKMRVQVGAEPMRLVIPELAPGEPATVSTLVYSQLWGGLTVTKVSCSIPRANCEVVPVKPESLAAVQGLAGQSVAVTLPADLPSGPFQGSVRIEAQPADHPSHGPTVLELPLSGRVLRRLAVYGDGVQENGVVDLGIHPSGKAWQHRLVLKVRDEDADLPLAHVQTTPDFLRVSLAPYQTESGARLYRLDISVPADAPKCIYRGSQLGELKLTFDHPRIRDLDLRLAFAIMPKR